MRILVLCYEYPPLGGGGGRVAQSIAVQMAARGHQVRVQTAALGWKSVTENDQGVEVFRTASRRRKADTCSVFEMGLYCATSFLPTLRHIRQWKPDVMHVHFAVPTGALAWAVHRLTGVPYVLTAHLGDVPGGVPDQTDTLFKMIGPVASQIWQRAAGATAVSTFVQELAEKAYHRPVTRILNGIDLRDALPAPPEAAPPSTPRFCRPAQSTKKSRLPARRPRRIAAPGLETHHRRRRPAHANGARPDHPLQARGTSHCHRLARCRCSAAGPLGSGYSLHALDQRRNARRRHRSAQTWPGIIASDIPGVSRCGHQRREWIHVSNRRFRSLRAQDQLAAGK